MFQTLLRLLQVFFFCVCITYTVRMCTHRYAHPTESVQRSDNTLRLWSLPSATFEAGCLCRLPLCCNASLPGLQGFSSLLFPPHCSTDILEDLKSGFYTSVASIFPMSHLHRPTFRDMQEGGFTCTSKHYFSRFFLN